MPIVEVKGLHRQSESCGEQKTLFLPRMEYHVLGFVVYSLVTTPIEAARHLSNNKDFMGCIYINIYWLEYQITIKEMHNLRGNIWVSFLVK
jgi:hypothetical protein